MFLQLCLWLVFCSFLRAGGGGVCLSLAGAAASAQDP